MSRTYNKVILIGNVGKKPELKHTQGGTPVISFRMATSETWKDKHGKMREQTDWHSVVAWRGLAEVIDKLVNKGSRIFVEGKLQNRYFDDSSTGEKKQVIEILADNMLILDNKSPDSFENSGSDSLKINEPDFGLDDLESDGS